MTSKVRVIENQAHSKTLGLGLIRVRQENYLQAFTVNVYFTNL